MTAYKRLHDTPRTIKPARRVTFTRHDANAAIIAASRLSLGNHCPWYVVPTAYGLALSPNQPGYISHYRITGHTVDQYIYDPQGA